MTLLKKKRKITVYNINLMGYATSSIHAGCHVLEVISTKQDITCKTVQPVRSSSHVMTWELAPNVILMFQGFYVKKDQCLPQR